jgi:ADP-ribose pyrophosphatase YjhB (NUDIX family)
MTNFTIGSFAVVFDKEKRVLLSHRNDMDIWNLPGGSLESGELPPEAAIRETLEETGLKIKIKRLVGVYGKPHRNELVFVFTAKVIGGKIKRTTEADETRFFNLKKIPENTIPKHAERIRHAVENHSKPRFSWQESPSARQWLKNLSKSK